MQAPQFDNSLARLPDALFQRLSPTPVSTPHLIRHNPELAERLGIDPAWIASADGVNALAGNLVPDGAEPLAAAYAGHQFGSWNPQLGDGRAVLLGELVAPDGARFDLQLKGSGPTQWSRGGDGRSPLGPVLREYLVSEAMHALGVPTTRALAAVTTGDLVYREEALPGAVLARVAASHLRVGTMQFFAARGENELLMQLVRHALQRHYPEQADTDNPAASLLEAVSKQQAALIARWQLLGFIHGVMNTDNMLLSGETVDYGPCAFMDGFHPDTVFSSIDQGGRYAYRNQPGIGQWNIAALAQALLPVMGDDRDAATARAQDIVDGFPQHFLDAHNAGMAAKLGLDTLAGDDDAELLEDLLELLARERTDFTLFFRRLSDLADPGSSARTLAGWFEMPEHFNDWLARWQARCASEAATPAQRQAGMYRTNPVVIPRNHRVDEALREASENQDYAYFHTLADVLARPFEVPDDIARYALGAKPDEAITRTFCGT